jgi:hypothetical protein
MSRHQYVVFGIYEGVEYWNIPNPTPCPRCGWGCLGHTVQERIEVRVTAPDADDAIERALELVQLRKRNEGWTLYPRWWGDLDAWTVEEIAREQARLTAWEKGLPIPTMDGVTP